MIKVFSKPNINDLVAAALETERKTARVNIHDSADDFIQEMLIVVNPETYIRPHSHPAGRSESYHVIAGVLEIVFLTDDFQIRNHFVLSAEGNFFLKHQGEGLHLVFTRERSTLFHEVLEGPYLEDSSTIFSPGAPDTLSAMLYLLRL